MMLNELAGRQAAKRGVWTPIIIIATPGFDGGAGVEDLREHVLIEEFVAHSPIETLDASIPHRQHLIASKLAAVVGF